MGLNGFVKLHRKMVEWGWYSDCVVKDVFIHILMVATFRPTTYLGHELKPGQAVIGRKKMAGELGFSEQQIRTALKKLESTGEITLKSTNRFTIATVENWGFYQCADDDSNQQITNNQPTDNQQITNNQPHLKNVKNVKNVKKRESARARGEFLNVFLTDAEYEKFHGLYENADEIIESLSNYKQRKGKNDDIEADYAWLKSFARTDGKPKAARKSKYEQYLQEAKLGYPPPDNAGLTEEEFEKLKRIAEENG